MDKNKIISNVSQVVARSLFLASFSVFIFTSFLGIAAANEISQYSDMKASVASASDMGRLALVSPVDDEGRGGGTGGAVVPTTPTEDDISPINNAPVPGAAGSAISTTGVIPTISIGANPPTVTAGESSKLTWASSNAKSCYIFNSNNIFVADGKTGSIVVKPVNGANTYKITCYGMSGLREGTLVITVKESVKPTITLTPVVNNIEYGASTKIGWTSTDAKSCVLKLGSKPIGSGLSNAGVSTGALKANATYVVTCSGNGGDASETVTVNVAPKAKLSTTLTVSTVNAGKSGFTSTIKWTSVSANKCALSKDTARLSTLTSGTMDINVSESVVIWLKCYDGTKTEVKAESINVE